MGPREQTGDVEILSVLRLVSAAAWESRDEHDFFQSMCSILVESGLFQLAWFGYADEGGRRLLRPLVHSEKDAGFVEDLETALRETDYEDCSNTAIRSGEACWIKDLGDQATRASLPPVALERGCTSVLSLPVIWEYRPRAALTLHYDDPDRFESTTVDLLMQYLRHIKSIVTVRVPAQPVGAKGHEAELRSLIDVIPNHIGLLTAEGRVFYSNRVALDYYGLSMEEVVAGEHNRRIHPDDLQKVSGKFLKACPEGLPFMCEVRLLGTDGQYRWFALQYTPLRDDHEQVIRWCIIGTDIHERKLAEERLQHENISLREEIDKALMFEEIVGTSAPLKKVISRISKVAPSDLSVLITGETGTGKELVARAIHRRSQRSAYPFVSVNCAVVPRDLIASELFGHEKGAFTGATQRRLGRFELAAGGTLFLDEVGELPADTQVALLRVLQEHEFERIGGTGVIRTDVRVITATNRDLEEAIRAGTFRSDLFYRLNVFPIEVPTLRERKEDIPLLVEYFLDRYGRKAGKSFRAVDKPSLDLLQSYPWRGNIRELQNVIERSVIVSETEVFSVDESWLSRKPLAAGPEIRQGLLRTPPSEEKSIIEAALRDCGGRVYGPGGAAEKLGIPRSTLESKIRILKINKNRFKDSSQIN